MAEENYTNALNYFKDVLSSKILKCQIRKLRRYIMPCILVKPIHQGNDHIDPRMFIDAIVNLQPEYFYKFFLTMEYFEPEHFMAFNFTTWREDEFIPEMHQIFDKYQPNLMPPKIDRELYGLCEGYERRCCIDPDEALDFFARMYKFDLEMLRQSVGHADTANMIIDKVRIYSNKIAWWQANGKNKLELAFTFNLVFLAKNLDFSVCFEFLNKTDMLKHFTYRKLFSESDYDRNSRFLTYLNKRTNEEKRMFLKMIHAHQPSLIRKIDQSLFEYFEPEVVLDLNENVNHTVGPINKDFKKGKGKYNG
jgi:hypothetical protein